MMHLLTFLAWFVGAAIVGLAIGIAIGLAITAIHIWRNPGDASAGSVGIIVIETGPAGLILGALIGLVIGILRM
jgi:hypothetical protein